LILDILPADFLGSDDPIDIWKETGVDRDVISAIVKNYVGFSVGSEIDKSGPLSGVNPHSDFHGWELKTHTANKIRWVSDGGFRLEITPKPDGELRLSCNAPDLNRHDWYRKGWTPDISTDKTSPSEMVELAYEWMADRELVFDTDLTQFDHIGTSTKDYLRLEYGISSESDLVQFASDHTEKFEDIFGESAQELISQVD